MRTLIDRTRSVATSRPLLGLLLLLLLALGVVFGLVGFWSAPRFHLWVNGEKIGEAHDEGTLREMLSTWATEEMSRVITLRDEGQAWSFPLRDLGLRLPIDKAGADLARRVAERAWWERTVEIQLELPGEWDLTRMEASLAGVREAVERPPVSASLQPDGDTVRVVSSTVGIRVDPEAVHRALRGLGDEDSLALPVEEVAPEVETEAIERLGIRRLIAEWSTHYDPSIPRADNVERAAEAFDGLILKPGEILSYNATVGPIDAATGWKEAYVIVAGELVPGIGGGVCQVATTLYGAALRANMEILERHQHQLAVGYIPPSEDAAVAQGYQDLKIRNTTPGHLLLKSESGDGTVTFRLYGDLPAGQEVRIESQVTGSLSFPTKTVIDPSLEPGVQEQVRAGIPGLTSEAYRLLFADGQLVKRELLSRDRYLPTARVVRTGPPPEEEGQE